jgi:probable HAF family extracellular repeat protein
MNTDGRRLPTANKRGLLRGKGERGNGVCYIFNTDPKNVEALEGMIYYQVLMSIRSLAGLLVSIAGMAFLTDSATAGVRLINLGALDGNWSSASAINDRGEVAGLYLAADGSYHAFEYRNGLMSRLDSRPGEQSSASAINDAGLAVGSLINVQVTNEFEVSFQNQAVVFSRGLVIPLELVAQNSGAGGINNRGQIVGGYTAADGTIHAFLYWRGMTTDLGNLGGDISAASGINDGGDVVGMSSPAPGGLAVHPFLYRHGVMRDLGTLGGNNGVAEAINDMGEIVGFSSTVSNREIHPFLYSHGRMQDLGTLGGDRYFSGGPYTVDSYATAINNWGQVVGQALTANLDTHAFLYSHGKMTDLNSLVALTTTNGPPGFLSLESAKGINDWGQIAGVGNYWDGTQVVVRAFLLESVRNRGD